MSKSEIFNITAIFGEEDSYGTLNSSGDGVKFNIVSHSIGANQNVTDINEIDGDYVTADPIAGNTTLSGDIVVRVRPKSIGYFLKWFYGSPTTSGSNPYTHTFTANNSAIKSFQLEVARSDISTYEVYSGLIVTKISMPVLTDGQLEMTVSLIGNNVDYDNSSSVFTGTVTDLTSETDVFNATDGTVSAGTTFKATNVSYAVERPTEQFFKIGDDGIASDVFRNKYKANGEVTILFEDTTLLQKTKSRTADNISVGASDGTNSITFANSTIKWDLTSVSADANTTQQLVTVPFRAYSSLTCTLVNSQSSYA